jgi:hypothetical protein
MSSAEGRTARTMDVAAAIAGVFKARPGEQAQAIVALEQAASAAVDGVDRDQLETLVAADFEAERPLALQRIAAAGYLARVRPGMTIGEGIADLTGAELTEFLTLIEEAAR